VSKLAAFRRGRSLGAKISGGDGHPPANTLVDLEVFYLGHLKNLYTIQYNTIDTTRKAIDCATTMPLTVFI